MIRLVFELDAPEGYVQAVKEHLEMYMERCGDMRLVSVTEIKPEQMRIDSIETVNTDRSPRG